MSAVYLNYGQVTKCVAKNGHIFINERFSRVEQNHKKVKFNATKYATKKFLVILLICNSLHIKYTEELFFRKFQVQFIFKFYQNKYEERILKL